MRLLAPLALASLACAAFAEDGVDASHPRLSAQLLFGTAGFEPGIAAEWRLMDAGVAISGRPELFINEDGKIGGGASLGWQIKMDSFNRNQDLTIGPRVVYHNSDNYGWEASAMAIYSFPFLGDRNFNQHYLQIIGALGIVQDREDDNNTVFGGTIGAAYAYQF